MFLPPLALVALLALAPPLLADTTATKPAAAASISELGDVLQLDALFEVLREEGVAHGQALEADMFPAGGGADWQAEVAQIYDAPRLRAQFDQALMAEFASDPSLVPDIVAFFGSDLGQRVIQLEIEARRAYLDTATEEAARVAADDAAANRDPKVALIRRMIEAGDLLEMNVAAAMSGSLAFMTGMVSTGVYGPAMPEDQVLSDIWSQEEQTRTDMSTWLYSFMGLAYHPLTEAELATYIEFWETPAGQRLNAALFTAFDTVFRQVSLDLGRAAGRAMQGRDI
jgi:Uncharacterized protein conserved in bacteria (DUF2059)